MRAALAANDGSAYVTADRDFHAEIVDAAGNTILSETYRGLRDRQLRSGVVNLLDASAEPDLAGCGRRWPTTSRSPQRSSTAGSPAAEAAVNGHLDHAEQWLGRR